MIDGRLVVVVQAEGETCCIPLTVAVAILAELVRIRDRGGRVWCQRIPSGYPGELPN